MSEGPHLQYLRTPIVKEFLSSLRTLRLCVTLSSLFSSLSSSHLAPTPPPRSLPPRLRHRIQPRQSRPPLLVRRPTKRIPPNGSNRGRYRNPKVDELTDAIRVEMNQLKRKALTNEVQKIVAEDLPYIPLWHADVVSVHQRTLGDLTLSPTGDYKFFAAAR